MGGEDADDSPMGEAAPQAEGAPVDAPDPNGWTALMSASANGHEACVKLLLEAKATVDQADNDGFTPLIIAAQDGAVDMVATLAAAPETDILRSVAYDGGAGGQRYRRDTETGCLPEGTTPLMVASRNRHLETVRLMISTGKVDIDAMRRTGETAVFIAARQGHYDLVQLLGNSGADLDIPAAEGWTATMVAARNGFFQTVQVLARLGADLNRTRPSGASAVWVAAQNKHYEVLQILGDCGADMDILARGVIEGKRSENS